MNFAFLTILLEAVRAMFNFFIIVFSKKQKVEQKSIEEQDELKEEMHKALLSGDNSAIVLCLNKYNQLRDQAKKS